MADLEIAKWCAYVITTMVAVHLVDVLIRAGITGVLKAVANFILLMPGANVAVKTFTQKEVDGYVSQAFNRKPGTKKSEISIPEKGIPVEELRKELEKMKSGDQHLSENGRLFAYVYTKEGPRFNLQREAFKMFTDLTLDGAQDERVEIVHAFMDAFMHDNALNPMVFPALRKFENEVVGMTASMLHGDGDVVGSVTSGGTESILMAMKTYRDRARSLNPRITKPTVVAPTSIHPAFEKAAHYFDLTMKHVPVNHETLTCDLGEYESAIDSNTILLLASAPAYPQAILDPVEAISEIAIRHKLPFHVDACFGGFMLPWIEKLVKNIPKWDFRVEGVTSISADLHKYGYATKGASVVCYRDSSIRKHQFFAYSGWSGGLFASPTMAGTRPGGHLAAAWIALKAMGQDGYTDMAEKLLATANKMKNGINEIEGLRVLGSPLMTAFGFGSSHSDLSIFAVSDQMDQKEFIPAPRQLRVQCVNLDPWLFWSPPDFNETLTYKVYYRTYNNTISKWSWKVVSGCEELDSCACRMSNVEVLPFETNDYAVVSVLANHSSEMAKTDDFAPYVDGFLQAPNFTVTVEDRVANLTITKPIRVLWSGELLTDILLDDFLEYTVQYWLKNESWHHADELTREAGTSQSITFRLRETQTYCFRLSLSGIQFRSAGWTEAICIEENTSPILKNREPSMLVLQIVLGCLGGIAIIFLCLTTYLVAVRLTRFTKGDRTIPASLAAVMNQNDSFRLEKNEPHSEENYVTKFVAVQSNTPERRNPKPNWNFATKEPAISASLDTDKESKLPLNSTEPRKPSKPHNFLPPKLKLLETVTEESGSFLEYVTAPQSPDSGLVDWGSAEAITWPDGENNVA